MGGYRRMGNVERQQHLLNSTWTTPSMHHLRDLWSSPKWTVLRIEALILVAIAVCFFLAICGSCRRWSSSSILQKGFLAANALFLSLGTYSIGLMQSSPVKSEMYPIWTVSFFSLLGCVDSSATTMLSIDNNSQLWKVLYQLCLNCAYVLMMSITTLSSDTGNIAICLLSAITFVKGFHRSMALVLPGKLRDSIRDLRLYYGILHLAIVGVNRLFRNLDNDELAKAQWLENLVVHVPLHGDAAPTYTVDDSVTMASIDSGCGKTEAISEEVRDVCVSYTLSHQLQLRFVGFPYAGPQVGDMSVSTHWSAFRRSVGPAEGEESAGFPFPSIMWAFGIIEVEMAFLYDVLFTSNPFLRYYEAKAASVWALASILGVLFVGVVAAMPGTRTVHGGSGGGGGSASAVDSSTRTDLGITLAILLSLALLQMHQLFRCWTSNWARVSIACDSARELMKEKQEEEEEEEQERSTRTTRARRARRRRRNSSNNSSSSYKIRFAAAVGRWLMGLRARLAKIGWFRSYLWQNKLGQHSLLEESSVVCRATEYCCCCSCRLLSPYLGGARKYCSLVSEMLGARKYCSLVSEMLGFHYMRRVLRELSWGCGLGTPVKLNTHVKAAIARFADQIKSNDVSDWPTPSVPGLPEYGEFDPKDTDNIIFPPWVSGVMAYHIATCYCELAQQQQQDEHHHQLVATTLSKYCVYLVASAPGLLPGRSADMVRVYREVALTVTRVLRRGGDKLKAMDAAAAEYNEGARSTDIGDNMFYYGVVKLGQKLLGRSVDDRWKYLEEFWVKALLYAAPSNNLEEHMQHLAQGGEFITHLWALLYHAGIDQWGMQKAMRKQEEAGRKAKAAAEAQAGGRRRRRRRRWLRGFWL